jgi:DNA-directed RNA polymerase specialized sigma24 family protein
MSESQSVTRWLPGIKAGDSDDIERLWNRYFQRLLRLAGSKLPDHCRRAFDEEDVAISAFQSFCGRAGRGQFPELRDRHSLWRLLATVTVRKAIMKIRHQTRQKRGGGRVLGESDLVAHGRAVYGEGLGGLAEILGKEPSPEDAACFTDTFNHLISSLGDPTLKHVALRRLQGHSSQEIGAELDASSRTVDRKLQLIRAIWEESGE